MLVLVALKRVYALVPLMEANKSIHLTAPGSLWLFHLHQQQHQQENKKKKSQSTLKTPLQVPAMNGRAQSLWHKIYSPFTASVAASRPETESHHPNHIPHHRRFLSLSLRMRKRNGCLLNIIQYYYYYHNNTQGHKELESPSQVVYLSTLDY